ncbi:hypothetical protein FJU08_05220 [Martelella alba]|uniref:M18 family aminopeptidase n=2 Tax=Martelella alba TaxID=2590451 RepID=A0A506UD85_9HYPH|nr:hypothetical protein FJU08_05220 [Martelella alba]
MKVPEMKLIDFLNQAVSPYHTVTTAIALLETAGFERLIPEAPAKPGKHYTVIGGKTLFAWIAPEQADAFHIVSAHTDFPSLRVKTEPYISRLGSHFLAIHPYDGPNLARWMDRDLKLAGRIYVSDKGRVRPKMIAPDLGFRTIGLPTHMSPGGDAINAQTDLHAFFGTGKALSPETFWEMLTGDDNGQPLEHDLYLHEAAGASHFGVDDGFVSSGRLDNLISCFSALSALAGTKSATGNTIPMVALFDAEEIGSGTWLGAKSPLLENLLKKLGGDDVTAMIGRSAQISLDVAHAVHPLTPELFDSQKSPMMAGGPVCKYGIRGNYAYSANLMAQIRLLASQIDCPLQQFTYRADRGQGGSLGPHSSTALSIRTIDLGAPIFAMHSIREVCAEADVTATTGLISAFLAASAFFTGYDDD